MDRESAPLGTPKLPPSLVGIWDPRRRSGWRPGGTATALMGRGRKHTSACRQVARALATEGKATGSQQSFGLREDERDDVGNRREPGKALPHLS